MSRAPEHRVQLAALDQNAQLPQPASSLPIDTDAAANNGDRPVDNMDVDGAAGISEESAGLGTGAMGSDGPSHASQAPAPAAAPSPQTKDHMLMSLIAIVQPMVTQIQNLQGSQGPVDQQALLQMYETVKPHWKAVKQTAKHSSTGKAAAVEPAGGKPSQPDTSCGAEQPASQTVAMEEGPVLEQEALASGQAVGEAAERATSAQHPTAADNRLSQAAMTSVPDCAPGEHASCLSILVISGNGGCMPWQVSCVNWAQCILDIVPLDALLLLYRKVCVTYSKSFAV